MRILLTLCLCAAASLPGHARMEWLSTDYDFGVMKEALGPQTGSVYGVNRGTEPTFISQVRPSCGCTGASYTEEVIMPGDTARVDFTYNPAGRPGRFEKTVKIYTGEEGDLTVVRIRGTVIGEPQSLEHDFPFTAGRLRYSADRVAMGDVRQGTSRHSYVKVYNTGDTALLPSVTGQGAGLEVELATDSVMPGDVGIFSLYLNTSEITEPGSLQYDCILMPGDGSGETAPLTVTADIKASGDLNASRLADAPSLRVTPAAVDTGELRRDRKVKWSFTVADTGKTALRVARVTPLDAALTVTKTPGKVKPSKQAKVEGTLDTSRLASGPFRLLVEVVTDDPLHPVVRVPVTGTVAD